MERGRGNHENCGGVGVKWGDDLGNGDNSIIRDLAVGSIRLNSAVFMTSTVFMTSVDGDLDGDGTTTDLLALESVDGLLLFSLVTDVNEAVSLAPSRLAPPLSNDAGRIDIETRISEESGKAVVVDVEAEVGNEENCLGGFADRILTGRAGETRSPGLALPWLGSILCGRIIWGSVCGRSGGLSFAKLGLVAAVGLLLFLLGLLRSFGSRNGFSLVSCLTIRLSVGDFSRDRFGTSSARGPLLGLLRPGFVVLVFRWFRDLDDYRATFELITVQSLDGLLGGLDGGESNETVTSGTTAITRPALNDLSADDVTLNWLEEGLQPFIRGGVRKISSKDLETGGHG